MLEANETRPQKLSDLRAEDARASQVATLNYVVEETGNRKD